MNNTKSRFTEIVNNEIKHKEKKKPCLRCEAECSPLKAWFFYLKIQSKSSPLEAMTFLYQAKDFFLNRCKVP
jgi:hypothetical protein